MLEDDLIKLVEYGDIMENYKVNIGISIIMNPNLPNATIVCSEDIYYQLCYNDENVKFKGSMLERLKHQFKKDKLEKRLGEKK